MNDAMLARQSFTEENTMSEEVLKLIVDHEVKLAGARGHSTLNDDGVYEARLKPIVEALSRNTNYTPETVARLFCEKIREVEANDPTEDVASDFFGPLQEAGHFRSMPDATAALWLQYDFQNNPPQLTPCELPDLPEGGERHFFTTVAGVIDFQGSFSRWDTHDIVVYMAIDKRYALDVVPKAVPDAD
ncbi:MAG: hypothetical protein WAK23_06485 [Terriglobales bacterium]